MWTVYNAEPDDGTLPLTSAPLFCIYFSSQGNGIFLSPSGDKYIGQWAGGKKHGKGRYCFANGDFYDGEFCKNKAHGTGVYYHTNGNIFTGQWVSFGVRRVLRCFVFVL